MKARLRMLNQNNSAAAFHLGPDVFGFEGARGTLFRNGPHMGGLRLLHPAEVIFDEGDWIDFEVIRNGDQVFFVIDGKVIDTAVIPGAIETLAFDPMRSTMEIANWSIAGDIDDVRPPHFDTRTFHTPWTDLAATRPAQSSPSFVAGGNVPFPGHVEAKQGPAVLRGRGHSTLMLPDGRVLMAFQDTLESSPTFGAGVLWCGTLESILEHGEGRWTTRLAKADNSSAR